MHATNLSVIFSALLLHVHTCMQLRQPYKLVEKTQVFYSVLTKRVQLRAGTKRGRVLTPA